MILPQCFSWFISIRAESLSKEWGIHPNLRVHAEPGILLDVDKAVPAIERICQTCEATMH